MPPKEKKPPGGGGGRVKKKRPKVKQAAQGVQQKEKKKRNWWWLLLLLLPLLLLLLLIPRGECLEKSMNPVLIMECLNNLYCWYPVEKKCPVKCPLGFKKDKIGCVINCVCASRALLQGDIEFTESSVPSLLESYSPTSSSSTTVASRSFDLNDAIVKRKLWDMSRINGRIKIPFTYKNLRRNANITVFELAIKDLSENTCIDFIPRRGHETWFIVFTDNGACSSAVGRIEEYGQEISIGRYCENVATVLHEILHALGLEHEQSRPDRDAFVKVHYDNINKLMWPSFDKIGQAGFKDIITEYDVNSLLHFPGYAFAINDNNPTITNLKTDSAISENLQTSPKDWHKINLLYKCYNFEYNATWSLWSAWSELDVTCGIAATIRFRDCKTYSGYAQGCSGVGKQVRHSQLVECATPNFYSQWGYWAPWISCSKSCGTGYQWRKRGCNSTNEHICKGASVESQPCNTLNCPSIASWGDWSSWTACTKSCGFGTKTTVRRCRTFDGKPSTACPGTNVATVSEITTGCNAHACDSILAVQTESEVQKIAESFLLGDSDEPSLQPFTQPYLIPPELGLCSTASGDIVIGDFNGDGFSDILCPVSESMFVLAHTLADRIKPMWQGKLWKCNNHKAMYAMDFNGDGKDDIACIERLTGTVYVKHSTPNGIFDSSPPTAYIKKCQHGYLVPSQLNSGTSVICHTSDEIVIFNNTV